MDPFPHSKQDSKGRTERLDMSLQTKKFCVLPKMMPGPICMDVGSEESLYTARNWRILKCTGSLFTSE